MILTISLTSKAFSNGGSLPADFTCDGRNISPPLAWSDMPATTEAYVLSVEDPDVPGTYTHWMLYDLLSGTSLPSGVPTTALPVSGGKQALNSAGTVGYTGPCPPHGSTDHYIFRVIALDTPTGSPPGANAADVKNAMDGHVIAMGQMTTTFGH